MYLPTFYRSVIIIGTAPFSLSVYLHTTFSILILSVTFSWHLIRYKLIIPTNNFRRIQNFQFFFWFPISFTVDIFFFAPENLFATFLLRPSHEMAGYHVLWRKRKKNSFKLSVEFNRSPLLLYFIKCDLSLFKFTEKKNDELTILSNNLIFLSNGILYFIRVFLKKNYNNIEIKMLFDYYSNLNITRVTK